MHDLIIVGGTVYDGFGGPGITADVAIADGRVAAIGADLGPARERIDADGLAVTPGFVDPHTHSDTVPFMSDPQPFKLLQGVTTEIVGNCGYTCAPTHSDHAPEVAAEMGHAFPRFVDYLDAVDAAGTTNHLAALVGHNTLRIAVAGFEQNLPSGGLERMCELADEAFAAGAVGWSTGLEYVPGAYAARDELIALAQVARRWGASYATHMRNEGEGLLEAVDEAIAVARAAGIRLQVSHCKASGHAAHGAAPRLLERLIQARLSGVDVLGDLYPYEACSTGLVAVLPTIASEGGEGRLRERLADPQERLRLRRIAEDPVEFVGAGIWREIRPDDLTVTRHADPAVAGRTLADIAGGRDPWDALCDLLLADPTADTVLHVMRADDVEAFMRSPLISIGSDNDVPTGLVHPRTYGTFPRFLGAYVRDSEIVSLGEAVRKMTSASASQFGLSDRGWLGRGAAADVCIFDPDTIDHAGNYSHPETPPIGMQWVLLEGTPVIRDGQFSGERRGRLLRAGTRELSYPLR
ncbi:MULTISPECIES: amidohydrolase family protein [unclassified Mycolicibacterium]|uniref:N-acyl-D-amino-acid deacylase family protein n=1 Tax=unclassified Mycolicibacterium TaxID=2636767 RepID=UPI00130CD140|nr:MULTISPECIES: amidohydrolase family protein [unclassified Mycolicibacterium]MUL83089.1 amidohydrolase family protein [Mycolicibacterium sp. CBMA 329]MUL89424.1 amidohydrolase family protein [Mycolicibacterium sp. CBMA 331]MUL99113.1 amidohydrolase family protein [Mycolicibacterium sp. CBMA 334]MUM24739.1 amidohydrolase family protein [Mycolicibacterium sp. CBMA 295]MUM38940.1 amidohydrolase family protein [Mycolicibacterium sp. CBMA 247]